ncbi:uncharacterized protein LOC118206370 [Anguilla anguilla]|uniref:uncharacterized protein LOC118206370 n=1 Tax=Anguilla anguilla TaxID=7936 RepID=UPI0015A8645F|nr:uncharacterized protein LOC118206370 [Anguilla anguilla]
MKTVRQRSCSSARRGGQVKLTNRIVGKRKVSSRKRKKVEYRPTEGDPRNTQAPFRLQDFKMWKWCTVLLLLALPPSVNSKETPTPTTLHRSSPTSSTASLGQCAVCLDKDCATGVRRIYPTGRDTAVWARANSPTGIQNCSMENLKADAPCKMANGSLVQLADNPLQFEGIDTRVFNSQILPCADLINSKPSPVTKTPIHNTPTPAAPNISVADNKDSGSGSGSRIGIGGGIGIFFGIVIVIVILIGVLIWKLYNCPRGLYRGRRQGNNGVPPHDTEHRDEITIQMQPLNAEVANGNVNGVH